MTLLALAGCSAASEPTAPAAFGPGFPQPGRKVCGWEAHDSGQAQLTIGADGVVSQPAPTGPVVVLSAASQTPFGAVRRALEPLESNLVRLKVVVDGRWLLPVTFPYRRPTTLPKPDQPAVRTVGHRRITRSVGAPADRFADVRLTGDRVQLFVEHGGAPVTLPAAKLADHLRATEPPVGTLALRVTEETAFEHFVTVLVAAACYDREPGDEAHEVILD
ncbi:MAG: hypothetical protein JRI68_01425 [Deltaproteobacteria bacterium]|nr:hypothetical protein [Deltaproteobacteria bacterium]